ncbi:MAG: hypothetical protein NTY31_00575 [Candidatus Falkowbacteria bacterium]|nr:hypothetical protein [Candidatus Falkowbacteria bacterium]
MAKFNVTGEQHFGIDGQMLEIKRQLRLKSGSPIDPEFITIALQDIIEGKFNHKKTANDAILRMISGGESIIIDSCDGSETIANAEDTFKSGVDSDFKKWGTDKPGQATEDTAVQVYEMVKDATFVQMFGFLGTDLDKLCLTQHQIKRFCKKHANWLRTDGYGTFFLFKVEDQYFVARVRVLGDGLVVHVFRLENDFVWNAEGLHRVVVPQLAA